MSIITLLLVGLVKAVVLPIAASLTGDVLKYGVDAGIDYVQGNEVGEFDIAGSLHNAAFDLAWSNVPGKYIFERFGELLKRSGGNF